MKNSMFILLLILVFSSCIKENKSGLVGQWQLVESNFGFGFTEIESDRIIDFFDDGTFSCTGDLCLMRSTSDQITTGTYSAAEQVFFLSTCMDFEPEKELSYDTVDGYLYLNYSPCFDICQQKYTRIK